MIGAALAFAVSVVLSAFAGACVVLARALG